VRRTLAIAAILVTVVLPSAPARAVEDLPPVPACAGAPGTIRADLAGLRLQVPGQASIYLIDPEGCRRGLPSWDTFVSLFSEHTAVPYVDTMAIADGGDLSLNCTLAQVPGEAGIYLISNGIRRGIASPQTMEKYKFRWDTVKQIPKPVMDAIPEGPAWR
jgi:hypothetical protein